MARKQCCIAKLGRIDNLYEYLYVWGRAGTCIPLSLLSGCYSFTLRAFISQSPSLRLLPGRATEY